MPEPPDDEEHPYMLISNKMMYLDISELPQEARVDALLAI